MKKTYIKPELGTKKFAQLENVYANCNMLADPCGSNNGKGGGQDTNIQYNPGWNYDFNTGSRS